MRRCRWKTWNVTVLWLLFSFFSFFYVSSCRLQVVILDRFARFMAQTTCSDSYTCLFRVWSLQIHFHWVSSPKNTKIRPPFWTAELQPNRFSIRGLKSKLPLNVMVTPQKLTFWLEVTNQEFFSHIGELTGSVQFPRWLPPPFWIWNNYCHFFTIRPILTQFDRNLVNSI